MESPATVAPDLSLPFLFTGEPGAGETQLACRLAGRRKGDVLRFNTKSGPQARDLVYRFDVIRHFRDSHQAKVHPLEYIRFEALGKAIRMRPIVGMGNWWTRQTMSNLDFANDLLFECAQLAFSIPEVTPADMAGFDCQRQHRIAPPVSDEDGNISCPDRQPRPVPVLTSNSDKNLREALPRRCAFHHIPFRTPGSACRPSGRTASSGNPSQKG